MNALSLLLAAALLPSLLASAPARACSCAGRPPLDYFAAADAVFVGVAPPTPAVAQRMQVLHVLKGRPGKSVALAAGRAADDGCAAAYQAGEVALVFVKAGRVSVCDGNYALSVMLADPGLEQVFAAAPGKPEPASDAALAQAFEATLTPYRHGRARWDGVVVDTAQRRGTLTFIAGRYPAEGVRFAVLVGDGPSGDALVYGQSVVERSAPEPYRCERDDECTPTCAAGAVNAAWLAGAREELTPDCEDGCTSKGSGPARCVDHTCTAFFGGAPSAECTRRPIPWRR
ncbi:MAG: hypothetical protein U1F43_25820 [Myxococcota bacterium]